MFKTALDKACSHKIIAFVQTLQGLVNPTLALKIIILGEFYEISKNATNRQQQWDRHMSINIYTYKKKGGLHVLGFK